MDYAEKPWINALGFQCYWWLCILLQQQALALCGLLLLLHLIFHRRRKREMLSLTILACCGFTLDSLLFAFGWYQFDGPPTSLPPLWLFALWLGFATSITTLSSIVAHKGLFIAAIAGLFAPLSYLAAAQLGAVTFPYHLLLTWLLLTPIWFFFMPFLFVIHQEITTRYE